jgi:hypothetical protein
MRDEFWNDWTCWRLKGAVLAADCPYPVESKFLLECVADSHLRQRTDGSPYPLLDVASVLVAAGKDPTAQYDRLPDEVPLHNPVADARQSARLLMEALRILCPAT